VANASTVANEVRQGLLARGVTLPTYVDRNLPATAQLFIAISSPVRSALRAFLTSLLGQLKLALARTATQISQCDIVSQRINAAAALINETLAPVDNLLASMPVDSALGLSPDLAALLQRISEFAPIKIPASVLTGGIGFDMFEGVNSYADLRKKGNDLMYLAAQAASVSYAAQTLNKTYTDKITEVEAYLYILDVLEISSRTLVVDTGSSVAFNSVAVGNSSYAYVRITNQSSNPASIGGAYTLAGDNCFALANPSVTTYILSTTLASLDIVLKFTPATAGSFSGTLSILHDASNTASPIVITLSGTGLVT
jgi:hypothetical protein